MNRLTALTLAVGGLLLGGVSGATAQQMQPGMWRFTQQIQSGGRTQSKTLTRCITPAQANNPAAYFAPRGRGCRIVSNSNWAGRLTASAQCVVGNVTSEVNSTVRVNSPTQISVSTTMTATANNRSAKQTLTGTGERIGECGGRRGGRRARAG